LPQAGNEVVVCHPRMAPPDPLYSYTFLPFCRIDGTPFKPLTTDRTATEQFYAVLKLGSGPCPNGAIEMVRRVDNEDIGNRNSSSGSLEPNELQDATTVPPSTFTTLHFCYFRWASTAADTMAAFPDLGFPYAVFHDFDGPQPSWVTVKRWLYGLDETQTSTMQPAQLSSVPDDAEAVKQFRAVVDDFNNATVFDLARVR